MGAQGRDRRTREVFCAFFSLGLRSFGGPSAHIGYLHEEFVRRRRWLGEDGFAALLTLSQLLPGPASSQLAMGIGLLRAGLPGQIAAWAGFATPSAVLMVAFALGLEATALPAAGGILKGLKLAALAVVAEAVRRLAGRFCRSARPFALATAALALALALPGLWGQLAAIALGAAVGVPQGFDRPRPLAFAAAPRASVARACAVGFLALLLLLPLASWLMDHPLLLLFDGFFRAGALIFGGGHVVLPLLREVVVSPGLVDPARFTAGYGAAQALPGPLLAFAAYLGMVSTPAGGVTAALVALIAIFLPSLLLVPAALPHLARIQSHRRAQSALSGANAAVVGLIAAALYHPLWTSSVEGALDLSLALFAWLLLALRNVPSWQVVALLAAAGLVLKP